MRTNHQEFSRPKRRKICRRVSDSFDSLPDDIVISILSKLGSSADRPSDFISVLVTCKRLNGLGLESLVLSKASPKLLSVRARNWSDSAHRFFKLCADSGNNEACYTLGMIRFYCLERRESGASLMARAAIRSHAPALYSLAVIHFNGSGASRSGKNLRAGVALCARAACLGHVDALRELGHCLQDGYGVRQNVNEGRRFLVNANARELASTWTNHHRASHVGRSLLGDYGCDVAVAEPHVAMRFMSEWHELRRGGEVLRSGLRLCSHVRCGRKETRRHEFRRCSVCGGVNYCSRACQALDWKLRHKVECVPVNIDGDFDGDVGEGDGVVGES